MPTDQSRCAQLIGWADEFKASGRATADADRFASQAEPVASSLSDAVIKAQWSGAAVSSAKQIRSMPAYVQPAATDRLVNAMDAGARVCAQKASAS